MPTSSTAWRNIPGINNEHDLDTIVKSPTEKEQYSVANHYNPQLAREAFDSTIQALANLEVSDESGYGSNPNVSVRTALEGFNLFANHAAQVKKTGDTNSMKNLFSQNNDVFGSSSAIAIREEIAQCAKLRRDAADTVRKTGKIATAFEDSQTDFLSKYLDIVVGTREEISKSKFAPVLEASRGHVERSMVDASSYAGLNSMALEAIRLQMEKAGNRSFFSNEGGGLTDLPTVQNAIYPLLGPTVVATDVRAPQMLGIDLANSEGGSKGQLSFQWEIPKIQGELITDKFYELPRDFRDGHMPSHETQQFEYGYGGDIDSTEGEPDVNGVVAWRENPTAPIRRFLTISSYPGGRVSYPLFKLTFGQEQRMNLTVDLGTVEIVGVLLKGADNKPANGRYVKTMSKALNIGDDSPSIFTVNVRNFNVTDNNGTYVGTVDIRGVMDTSSGTISLNVHAPSNEDNLDVTPEISEQVIGVELMVRRVNVVNTLSAMRTLSKIQGISYFPREYMPMGTTVIADFSEYVSDGATGKSPNAHIQTLIKRLSDTYGIIRDKEIQDKMDAVFDITNVTGVRNFRWDLEHKIGAYATIIKHDADKTPKPGKVMVRDPFFITDKALVEKINNAMSDVLTSCQFPNHEKGTWTLFVSEDQAKFFIQDNQKLHHDGSTVQNHMLDETLRYGVDMTHTLEFITQGNRQMALVITSENRYRYIPTKDEDFRKDRNDRFVMVGGEKLRRAISMYYKSNDPGLPIVVYYPRSMHQHLGIDPEQTTTFGTFLSYRYLIAAATCIQARIEVVGGHTRYSELLE